MVADRLKAWREAQGLSQAEAARLADTTQPTWHRLETGEYVPKIGLLLRLCALTADDTDHRVTPEMFAASARAS